MKRRIASQVPKEKGRWLKASALSIHEFENQI